MKTNETAEIVQCSSKRIARTGWGSIAFNKEQTRFFLMGESSGHQTIAGCQPFSCREVFPTPMQREQILNTWRDGKAQSRQVQLLHPELKARN